MRHKSTNTLAIEAALRTAPASLRELEQTTGLPNADVRAVMCNLVRSGAVTYQQRFVPWALRPVAFYTLAKQAEPLGGCTTDLFAALARAMRPGVTA